MGYTGWFLTHQKEPVHKSHSHLMKMTTHCEHLCRRAFLTFFHRTSSLFHHIKAQLLKCDTENNAYIYILYRDK